ncbi:Heat shock 70 kDa protein 13 [Aphelenchoides fujianensis]|nr:Heat shock 70 kDa protein 13 [Aphelenchoides fujianensis]
MSTATTLFFGAVFSAFLAGYLANLWGYNLPPPKPKAVGIDLGTTFSSIGIHQAVTDRTQIVADALGKQSVPSVAGFLRNGTVLIGTRAVEQQEVNPKNTIYDAKRFIGKTFRPDDPNFLADKQRYPFRIDLDADGRAFFTIETDDGDKPYYPEQIGQLIVAYLKQNAEEQIGSELKNLVISVPAEFDSHQRNATRKAAELADFNVWRVISEPTAAALAYGLHKKTGVTFVIVVDLGGGTMDVSQLRLEVEQAKLRLTERPETWLRLQLRTAGKFEYLLTRTEFEQINAPLFDAIVDPIHAALEDAELKPADIDEIVLVGGSTRMPRVRQIVGHLFGKAPNFGIDPELAVATGVAVQADVLSGGWPLRVAAVELQAGLRKRHIYTRTKDEKHHVETERLE